ncbi:AarF/ABC1/UbiB kinase family protein [bacterium]|nr:AarF/ABC1/UbiB kinase family protein [bacterium]
MSEYIPESKLKRSVVGGRTAANVGGKVLKYLAKKPFLNKEEQKEAKRDLEKDYAEEIFKGLVLLKGTALKIAQLLSFELDTIPSAIRIELEKSYNQVPPINRALVRKVIQSSFQKSPEDLFKTFEHTAFAAASLGQVHLAQDYKGKKLAVKIQYPGIDRTIKNDLQMVRSLIKPTPYARFVLPVLEEIEKRLKEEIDYLQEAENTTFFQKNLNMEGVVIPVVETCFCTQTVLTTQFLEGQSLDKWISSNPPQEKRDRVAALLHGQFLKSLFELKCLHADPNPGNFIIMGDEQLGLVDFGCVKRFSDEFIELYKKVTRTMIDGQKSDYFEYLEKMNVLKTKIDKKAQEKVFQVFRKIGAWYGRLYESDTFDFNAHPDFIVEGKKIMQDTYQYKKYFQPNPEFVFLNRTHYGLFRIFEKLGAKVRIKNPYEWG